MPGKSVTRRSGEGEALWLLGGLYEVKVSSQDSGGTTTVMEISIPEGAGPPPHTHDAEETAVILEGRVRYHVGDQTTEVGPGTVLFFPRGTEEWFEPLAGGARTLAIYSPGGIDNFFREFGEPAARRELPPPMEAPPDFARLAALAEKHGLHMRQPVS